MSVSHYVDSLRRAVGKDNVILLDAGDCLQGDNASYYFNYVDTVSTHLFPRLVSYMGYDAVAVGNHDIEAGHGVYDRVAAELRERNIPLLGANVLKTSDGLNYFPSYTVLERAGLKVLVLGFENANINAWLSEAQFKGMSFISLVPFVQECADIANRAFNPDVTVVVMHSGVGDGDGKSYESQGLDVFNTLEGVDVVICGHDHSTAVVRKDGKVLVDGGTRARGVCHSVVTVDGSGKSVDARYVRLDKDNVDLRMRRKFDRDFRTVRDFTNREVGRFTMTMSTRDAYRGMSDYVNLIHSVQLGLPEAKLSFAAPLTFDGTVREGVVLFNDMFTIYPYENQLSVVNMTGAEIKAYMEYSYDQWIVSSDDHVLKIEKRRDGRNGSGRWSFVGRSYNFDSVGGLVYTVDVTRPFGERIHITGLADGSSFNLDGTYPVAMTSYRANGGGGLMEAGAGLSKDEVLRRTVARYPEIRDLVYGFIRNHGTVSHETVSDAAVIGSWKFVPLQKVTPLMAADMELLF